MSAYYNDEAIFRILTMIIAGALVMATSIVRVFASLDVKRTNAGCIVMRVAMTALWLRAAGRDGSHRRTAMSHAIGIAVVQVLTTHHAEVGPVAGALAATVPLSLCLAILWFVRDPHTNGPQG